MPHLQYMIENYRSQMFTLAAEYGLTSPETVKCSQQLDRLLNLLIAIEQEIESNKKKISS